MADVSSTMDYLKKVPIFSALPRKELEWVARAMKERTYEPGAVIVKQGDPGVGFFMIAEGRVEVTHDGHKLRELGPGHVELGQAVRDLFGQGLGGAASRARQLGPDLGQPNEQLGLLGLQDLEILLGTQETFELGLGLGGIGLDGLKVRTILSGEIGNQSNPGLDFV